MELAPLRSFLAVAREGHMTRAARHLHLSQPAVSAQIARLEEELGTSLFHRGPRGMELTAAGALFQRYVERAVVWLEDGRDAVDALQGLGRGTLSVGGGETATTYLLPPLLREFHEHYPGVRLYVREQGSTAVVDALLAGSLDLGVVTLPVDPAVADALAITPWVADDLRLVLPPEHPLHGQSTFAWSDLDGQPLVLFEGGTAVRRVIDAALDARGVSPEIVMELRSIESIKRMVDQGIGAAFVSRFALPAPDAGLVPAEGAGDLTRTLAVAWRADRAPPPAASALLSLMAPGAPDAG